jgi:hypothetical protein
MAADANLPTTTGLHDVSEKLLEHILSLLMESPLCLTRAAVTCKRWRQIIAHHRFCSDVINDSTRPRPHPVAGSYHSVCPVPSQWP